MLLLVSVQSFAEKNKPENSIISLSIDHMSVDVGGVEQAMKNIESQLVNLTSALSHPSSNESLSDEDKQLLQQSIQQLNQNSAAMTILLKGLPQQIDNFNQQLPQLASHAQEPLKNLALSLTLLNNTANSLTEQMPLLLKQAQHTATQTTNVIGGRILLFFAGILLLLLAAIIISLWVLNKKVVQPIRSSIHIMSQLPDQQLVSAQLLNDIADKLTILSNTQAMPLDKNESNNEPPLEGTND